MTLHAPLAKLALTLLLWGYLQHLLGGLRFLLLDIHIGAASSHCAQAVCSDAVIERELTLVIAGVWLG